MRIIPEPIWSYKYDKGLLDPDADYIIIGFGRLWGIIKGRIEDCKLRHLKIGKIRCTGKPFDKSSFYIEGISPDIAWQTDRYLAILLRDYLRFHISKSPVIGNCVLRDNPEGIPYEEFLLDRDNSDIDFGKRWRDLVNKTADEFDEIRMLIESDQSYPEGHEEILKEKIDAAFKDLAYIYRDLEW